MGDSNPKIVIKARDDTRRAFRSVRKSLGRLKSTVFNMKTALVGLAGVAGFGMVIKQSFKTIDTLAKQADQLGMTTKSLAGFKHAIAITTDGSVNFQKAMLTMQRTIREADNGLVTYSRAYDELGLKIKDLQALGPDKQFMAIADALNQVENSTRRNALAMDIFGTRNAQLVNTARLGTKGLEAMAAEAEALGLAINRIDAAQIEASNDAFTRMKGTVTGVANRIAVQLAPYLESIANHMVNASVESEGFKKTISDAIGTVIKAVGFLADAWRGLEFVWAGLKVIFLQFISFTVDGLITLDASITSILNKLPGQTSQVSAALDLFADQLFVTLLGAQMELENILNKPLPSVGIDAWFAKVKANAIEAAKVVALQQGKIIEVSDATGKKLVLGAGKAGKEQFKLTKELNLAMTIADLPTAVSGAYKIGASKGGPILGAIFAASAFAFVSRQVSAARGVSMGGGGASGGGSAPAPVAAPEINLGDAGAAPGLIEVNITVDGTGKLDTDQAEEIAQSVADLIADGFQTV